MKKKMMATLMLLGLIGGFTPWAMAADPIKIGALYNLTGNMSSIDAPGMNGAKLKAKLINQAGGLLKGRMVEVAPMDTGSDLKAAAEGAKKVLSMGVVAGLGYGDTSFTLSGGRVVQEYFFKTTDQDFAPL